MNCALYLRKSTDDERHDGKSESVERQEEFGRAFAAKHHWTVTDAHVYADVAVSGGDFARPGLSRLLDALKAKQPPFEHLVVMEQSRLGRDVARTLLLIETIEDAGVSIYGYVDGRPITLRDESGENAAALRGIVDNSEKRRARGRTREGLTKKARAGHVVGAMPFGYTGVRVGGEHGHTEFRVTDVQAEVVRRVYALYADGLGGGRIVNTLRAEGAPAPGPKGWSKDTVRAMLNRAIYVGVVETRCSTGDAKQRGQNNVISVQAPHLRIVPEELERRVRARQAAARATLIRSERGHLISQPEIPAVAKYLCNSIARCHMCGGPLIFVNKGRRHTPSYYCGNRKHRGTAVCSNTAGVPCEGLDYGVTLKLADMLNRDFDTVLDLCMEQAQVWRERRAMPKDQRAQLEREQKRLEGAISRLLDQIEAGQAVGNRLKQRQEELDMIKAKLDVPPDLDREAIAALVAPLGPLVGLGMGDPVVIRQVLKKIGVERIVVTPDGPDAWTFKGTADFGATLHRRLSAPPPDSPHRDPLAATEKE